MLMMWLFCFCFIIWWVVICEYKNVLLILMVKILCYLLKVILRNGVLVIVFVLFISILMCFSCWMSFFSVSVFFGRLLRFSCMIFVCMLWLIILCVVFFVFFLFECQVILILNFCCVSNNVYFLLIFELEVVIIVICVIEFFI